jgi:hypothetical protein
MWNSTAVPRQYLSGIYFAGVKDFDPVKRCGFTPFATVEEALDAAQGELERDSEVTLMLRPPQFIARASA